MGVTKNLISPKSFIWVLSVVALSGLLILYLYKDKQPSQERLGNTVKILSWWGYLNHYTKISEIGKICDTQIQVKEYLNVDDLQAYASFHPYDVYIYPWSYHKDIEQHFKQQGPKIDSVVADYQPAIRHQYSTSRIPKDTVYFQLAISMFAYDKNLIQDLSSVTVDDIIHRLTAEGKVILMDELKQLDWLLKQSDMGTLTDNWTALYHMFRANQARNNENHSGLHFSMYGTAHFDKDLVLGNLYSGEYLNSNFDWQAIAPNLNFGVHPKLSQIASDVLALKSNNSSARCVAQEMASRPFLKWVSEENAYFSPFQESIDSIPERFKYLTQEFYDKADQVRWIDDDLWNDPPDPDAAVIWNILRRCQDSRQCGHWTAIGDKTIGTRMPYQTSSSSAQKKALLSSFMP